MMDYKTLKKNQISFQLHIPSLVGMYGKHIEKKAKILLKAGMYDLGGRIELKTMRQDLESGLKFILRMTMRPKHLNW